LGRWNLTCERRSTVPGISARGRDGGAWPQGHSTAVLPGIATAAALLDAYPGFASFTDDAVRRDAARRLVSLVEIELVPGGDWLLAGQLEAEIHTGAETILRASQRLPPGSPARPATAGQLQDKLADCVHGLDTDPASWTWENAADVLRWFLAGPPRHVCTIHRRIFGDIYDWAGQLRTVAIAKGELVLRSTSSPQWRRSSGTPRGKLHW
jgi:hypothetical protein